MPGVDWIPGVSQLKSVVQAVTGDTEGAKQTMVNFARECPGVAQVTSLAQLATGDAEGAWETQKICAGTVNNVANGIPVVGHAKGVVHHLAGDHEGGNQALNAATRSTVVVASGAAAAIATGGVGAIPAGIAAGVSYDVAATTVTGEDHGYVAVIKNASENPSGGAIFDALALPVGDGLAGYSGGKMATKVKLSSMKAANEAKISALENTRNMKLDQINAMMDGPGTSGESMQLGAEVTKLSREINTLKHGTPVFWDDVKSGNAAPTATSTSTSTTVKMPVGYVDKSPQERNTLPQNTTVRQHTAVDKEDALYHESYVDAIITESNREDRKAAMKKLDNQTAQKSIQEAYRNVGFRNPTERRSLLNDANNEENRDPDDNPKWTRLVMNLSQWTWLLLNMTGFPYRLIVQQNSMIQGYYHSFIRHMNDWTDVISFDSTLIQRLRPLAAAIREYASATDEQSAVTGRENFLAARQQLTRNEYYDVQLALVEIQLLMHSFMEENLTYDNYVGRTVTARGMEQLFFKVTTTSGRTRIMVVCPSEDRYKLGTQNGRPLRILTTVFFISESDFENSRILEPKRPTQNKKEK